MPRGGGGGGGRDGPLAGYTRTQAANEQRAERSARCFCDRTSNTVGMKSVSDFVLGFNFFL